MLKLKKCVDPVTLLPAQYHNFLDVFSKDNADKLPSLHPEVDHKIKIEPGTQALSGPLFIYLFIYLILTLVVALQPCRSSS